MSLTMELIKADIAASEKMIEEYKTKKYKSSKNVSAYHLQQATEKLIKIQIYAKAKPNANLKLYTHNISALIKQAQVNQITIYIPKYISKNAMKITNWEASSRYDFEFNVRITTLEKTYKEITIWYDYLKAYVI